MINKSDVIVGFVPEETKLENWLDEQLKKQDNIDILNKYKFLVLIYYDISDLFFSDRERETFSVTNNFVCDTLKKYRDVGKWNITYEFDSRNKYFIFLVK